MRSPLNMLIIVMVWAFMSLPAQAVTLLRDADIEYSLRKISEPILRAAGLSPSGVKVLVVKSDRLNAFVVDHKHIFIHSGLLLRLKSPAQLQSIIAHEAAHISNGHISRRYQNLRTARSVSGLGVALALAAAAAGADPRAAGAVSVGVSSSANRAFLSHTRAEEAAADAAGVRYMLAAGANPTAFLEVLELFRGQELVSENRRDPYARTHPLSRDRLRAVKALAQGAAVSGRDGNADYWFARAQGKLSAFLRAPSWTLRRANKSQTKDIAQMRKAIAYHRTPDFAKANAQITGLLAQRPKDPFLHELHGQILLESRRADQAVAAYARAAALATNNALILGGQGRALLAAGQYKRARQVLEEARARDHSDARILRDLGQAYARLGQGAMASVLTAERYALRGRFKDAKLHAERALGQLSTGSPAALRARDVLSAADAQLKKRK